MSTRSRSRLVPDDLYLLCSDGLTDMISADEIHSLLADSADLDLAARSLIEAANARGGEDNITVVLFQIGDRGEVEQTAQIPVAGPKPTTTRTRSRGSIPSRSSTRRSSPQRSWRNSCSSWRPHPPPRPSRDGGSCRSFCSSC